MEEVKEKDIVPAMAKVTTNWLEYNISQYTKKILARKNPLEVIKHMVQVNVDLYAQSISNNNKVWNNATTFPKREKFDQEFKVCQEILKQGYITMYMHMKIVHKISWKDIKFHYTVLSYLKRHQIIIIVDNFETKKIGSPGFITKVHPKLVNLKTLHKTIKESLGMVNCNDKKVVIEWKSNKKWGQINNRTEATVIIIQSVAEDTPYLKTLLLAEYE
eukprot:9193588-Ditylum_brightwellii.AAC.1